MKKEKIVDIDMKKEKIVELDLETKVLFRGRIYYVTDISFNYPPMPSPSLFPDIHDYYFLPREQTVMTMKLNQY